MPEDQPSGDDADAARITPPRPDAETDRAALTRAAHTFFTTFFSGSATNPTPAVLRSLRITISDTRKGFAAHVSLVRAKDRDHVLGAGTQGVPAVGAAADALAREHLVRRLQTILGSEDPRLQTPNELSSIDDCLAALTLMCNALAKRSTKHDRPLNASEWADLDRLLIYSLMLVAAHDSRQAPDTPPQQGNPPPHETPRPDPTTHRVTRRRPSDEPQ